MSTLEKLAMLFVWLALTASGAWFFLTQTLAGATSHRESPAIKAGIFIALVAVVCTIGVLAFASRDKEVSGGPDPPADRIFAAIKTSLLWHLGLALPCLLMLDGGGSAHIAVVALAAYWPMVFLLVLRRVQAPTKLDLIAIRHGYPFVWLAIAGFGPLIWARMGHFGP
jgi:hypothetical protein